VNPLRYVTQFVATIATALGVVVGTNIVVDPFGFRSQPILAIDQTQMSDHANDQLYRLARFRANPRSIVVLGDSRAKNLRESYFAELGVDVANLAYGGGTLFEAIETFWFVDGTRRPTDVILGLPFNLWSDANARNFMPDNKAVLDSAPNYFLSYYVFNTAVRNLQRMATGDTDVDDRPPTSPAAFWQYQLGHGIGQFYGRWREPVLLRAQLERLVQHCRVHGIRLIIVNPPTHIDLQHQVAAYGLEHEYAAYRRTMAAYASFLDLDVTNLTTSDRSRFGDPFHARPDVMREVTALLVQTYKLRAASTATVQSQ
jgi:hypothetical protein